MCTWNFGLGVMMGGPATKASPREGRRKTGYEVLLAPSGDNSRVPKAGSVNLDQVAEPQFSTAFVIIIYTMVFVIQVTCPFSPWGRLPLWGHLCSEHVLLSAKSFLCHHPEVHSSTLPADTQIPRPCERWGN